jgi:hypothetical protein
VVEAPPLEEKLGSLNVMITTEGRIVISNFVHTFASSRFRLLLAAGLIAVLFLVQGARGDQFRMVNVDVALNEGQFSQISASGNPAPEFGTPYIGDVFSGQAPIMNGSTRIGSFYFMSVGTVPPGDDNFVNAANNIFAVGRLELWGQGSIDVQGTVTFFGNSYLSITGGTGMYGTATGQCTEVSGGGTGPDHFMCEVH